MNKIFSRFLVFTAAVIFLLSPCALKAENAMMEGLASENEEEPVAIELKSGRKVVVYVIKETKDELFVRNLSDNMEVSIPRANVVSMGKATEKDIEKMERSLGIKPETAPSKETKK